MKMISKMKTTWIYENNLKNEDGIKNQENTNSFEDDQTSPLRQTFSFKIAIVSSLATGCLFTAQYLHIYPARDWLFTVWDSSSMI